MSGGAGGLSPYQAEALALLMGLNWADSIGLQVKAIFSDSLALVMALQNSSIVNNELGVIFSDIKVLLSNLSGASLSHVSRKFNVAAHRLAKHALWLDNELSWLEVTPPPLL